MAKLKRKLDGAFLKLTKAQTILLGFGILVLVALVIGIVLVVAGTGPTITLVDGKTADSQGNITSPVSTMPAFSGKAPANSLVSVYQTPINTVTPKINKASGQSDLQITHVPAQPGTPGTPGGPVPFTYDFCQGNVGNFWMNAMGQQQGFDISNCALHLLDSGNGDNVVMTGRYTTDKDVSFQINMTVPTAIPQGDSAFSFEFMGISADGSSGSGDGMLGMKWFSSGGSQGVQLYNNSGQASLSGNTNNMGYPLYVSGQTYAVKIHLNVNTGLLEGYIDGNLVVSATVSGYNPPQLAMRIISNNMPVDLTGFTSNATCLSGGTPGTPATPESWVLNGGGMQLNGVSYTDPFVFNGPNAPGVMVLDQQMDLENLPHAVPSGFVCQDLYVYLTTLTLPAGVIGNTDPLTLRWTIYSASPDNPDYIQFLISTVMGGMGWPLTVDGFAKVATASCPNYNIIPLPINDEGSMGLTTQTINYTWPPYINSVNGVYQMSVSPLEYNGEAYDVAGEGVSGKGISTSIINSPIKGNDWIYQNEPISPVGLDGTKNINVFLLFINSNGLSIHKTVYTDGGFDDLPPDWKQFVVDSAMNVFIQNGTGKNYTFNPNAVFTNSGSTLSVAIGQSLIPTINPPSIPGTLIAKARADASGNWIATFGKDETGKVILAGDLTQFGLAPYKIFSQVNGINSSFVVIQSVSQDSDGDGINDNLDHCPAIKGTGPRPTTYKLEITNFKSTASGITAPKVFVGANQIQPDTAGGSVYTIKLSATDNDNLNLSNGDAKKLQAMKGAWIINRIGDKIISGVWGHFTQNGYVSYTTKVTLDGSNNFYVTNGAEENDNRFESQGDSKSTVGDVNQDEYTVNGQIITAEGSVRPSGDLYTIHVKDYDGCPYAIDYAGRLQIQYSGMGRDKYADDDDQFNSNWIDLVPGPIGDTLKDTINQVNAKVFKASDFSADKNQGQVSKDCAAIYDSTTKTPVNIDDITFKTQNIGVPIPDNYILAVRVQISDPAGDSRTTTVCRLVQKSQFDTKTGSTLDTVKIKAIFIMKKDSRGNNCKQFDPATEDLYSGSELSVVHPEDVKWEEGIDTYVYPYIFSSDLSEDWNVNVCMYTPAGYQVVGAYDENGILIPTSDCMQTIVPNQEKIVAFKLLDVGSPSEFDTNTALSMVHKGKVQKNNASVHAKKTSKADLTKKMPEKGQKTTVKSLTSDQQKQLSNLFNNVKKNAKSNPVAPKKSQGILDRIKSMF